MRESVREQQREVEANEFALALLMPEKLLKDYLLEHSIELNWELDIRKVADAFEVTVEALKVRLIQLGWLRSI